jgi:tetratricopeptide (TPR) repeat protein
VQGGPSQQEAVAAGVFGGLILAFSRTWWENSTSIEVYPLHVLFLPIVLLFFFRMLRNWDTSSKNGFFFALFLGLSFANHLTTVLLAPACLYAFFARFGVSGFRKITRLVIPFVIGLLPYFYLPLRSATYPIMDWGHPAGVGSFLKHVTGGQYKVWMFTGGSAGKQFSYFWSDLPSEFTLIVLAVIVLGLVAAFGFSRQKNVHLLGFILLLFFGCLFYAINYDIHDIDSYFLLSYLALGILASCAFVSGSVSRLAIMRQFVKTPSMILLAGVLCAGLEVGNGFSEVNESGNHMVDDFAHNTISNLPQNAIIFSSAWDFWVSGSFYLQHIEKLRPDVTVIDLALLRDRPWYYSHIKQVAPQVLKNCEAELDAFFPELVKFDRGDAYDGALISEAYKKFSEALVRNNQDRPIFIASEAVAERDELFAPSFKAVPGGVAFRLVSRDTVFDPDLPKLQWNDKKYRKRNYYTDNARLLQALPLAAMAQILAERGDIEKAKRFLDLALSLEPDMKFDISKLEKRDLEFAQVANERFGAIAQLRAKLK